MTLGRTVFSQIGPYSPIVERPRLQWPGGARLALWIVPNIEYYEMRPRVGTFDPWSRCPHPDLLNYGMRDYGNRVGFWRLMPLLERLGVRATLSLNIACYQNFPQIREFCETRGYDVMCHGMCNTDFLFDRSEDGERAYIAECRETFRRLTGRDFTGWFSPVASGTVATSDLIAEAGIAYTADFFHDDQPSPIRVRTGRLLSLPYSMDVNEGWNLRLNIEAEEFVLSARDQFDRLYQESADIPRVMSLALHPYVFGQPHRIAHLERLLAYMLGHDGVWQATGIEIAEWYNIHCLAAFEQHLGADPALPGGPELTRETRVPPPSFAADNPLYPYSALPGRPALAWPEAARLAVCVNLFFETFSADPALGTMRDARWKDRFKHDCRMYTWYEYGNRVGIFRILSLLDRYGLRATVAANAEACERFPYLVEAFRRRDYEFAAHGLAANAMITGRMSEAEQRTAIAEAIDRVERAAGTRPGGWISQDYAASVQAPRLLAELGMTYVADWPNDEQPYRMTDGLVSIPNYGEWDDVRLLWDRRLQMPRYPQIVGEAFARLHEDGAAASRFFSLNIHPWVLGAAHRIRYLETVIAAIAAAPNVWHCTASEVAGHVLRAGPPPASLAG